jgi:hypothetical protein
MWRRTKEETACHSLRLRRRRKIRNSHISLLTGGFSAMLTLKEMPLSVHFMRLGIDLFT